MDYAFQQLIIKSAYWVTGFIVLSLIVKRNLAIGNTSSLQVICIIVMSKISSFKLQSTPIARRINHRLIYFINVRGLVYNIIIQERLVIMFAAVMFNSGRVLNVEFDAWNKASIISVLEEQKAENLIIDYAIREYA